MTTCTICDNDIFDKKNNLIKEYTHWYLLIRNRNWTLGNCVVILKRHAEALSQVTEDEMKEFATVTKETEHALKKAFNYDKINWMLLMMSDNHVHFHVAPRYEKARTFTGLEWTDTAWPAMTKLFTEQKQPVAQEVLNKMKEKIRKHL
ncbi:MAG: HIT family protein [Nanoarchaeota archaeon]